jgi:ATP-binding cassette, subfamily C (CFTR/MRP), member 1
LLSLISAGLTRLFFAMSNNGYRIVEVEILLLAVLVLMFGISDRRPEYQNIDEKSPTREQSNASPEMTAGAGNKMLFLWFFQLTFLSCRNKLDEQAVWSLDPEMKCDYFVEEFTQSVTQLVQDTEVPQWKLRISFFATIVRTFGELVLVATIQRLFLIIAFFVCPFILRELISYAKTGGPYQTGLYYSLILCAISFMIAILNGQYAYNNKKFAMQTWSALVSTVFKKAMRINDHAVTKDDQKRDVGVIINLLMSDAEKFGQLCMILNTAWSTVVIIVAASICLWTVLGWSFLSGLVVISVVIVANYYLVKKLKVLQRDKMYLKDQRIKLTDEILEGIKILKYYAWEQCFQDHLSVIRINEVDALRTIAKVNLVKYVVWILAPFMVSCKE